MFGYYHFYWKLVLYPWRRKTWIRFYWLCITCIKGQAVQQKCCEGQQQNVRKILNDERISCVLYSELRGTILRITGEMPMVLWNGTLNNERISITCVSGESFCHINARLTKKKFDRNFFLKNETGPVYWPFLSEYAVLLNSLKNREASHGFFH